LNCVADAVAHAGLEPRLEVVIEGDALLVDVVASGREEAALEVYLSTSTEALAPTVSLMGSLCVRLSVATLAM